MKFVQSRDGEVISRMGLFNLNFEYFVFNPWLEKLNSILSTPAQPSRPTTASVAKEAVSGVESRATSTYVPPPAQLNVSLSDCTIGLNPLGLLSRGLLLVTSTTVRGQWDFKEGGRGKFDVSLSKAHLFCIDDVGNLAPPPRMPRGRTGGRKETLAYFSVQPR